MLRSDTMTDYDEMKKQDELAISLRITDKQSNRMNDTTFYRYTIEKQNEQLTPAQYSRYIRLFKDPTFKRPTKPLSKYPTAYDIMNNKKFKPKSKPSRMSKPKPKSRGLWIGNMFKSSNKRLSQIARSGTPKQKSLARKILKSRK
jgi:hypothetical protein